MVKEVNVVVNDVDLLINQASDIIDNTYKKVNTELIVMCWKIGKVVNEYKGEHNSKYGDGVILKFAEELSKKYGSNFSWRNIYNMCKFNYKFEILQTSAKSIDSNLENDKIVIVPALTQSVSWVHFIELLKPQKSHSLELIH